MSKLSDLVAAVEAKKANHVAMAYTHVSVRIPDVDRLLEAAKALETSRTALRACIEASGSRNGTPDSCQCGACIVARTAIAAIDKALDA